MLTGIAVIFQHRYVHFLKCLTNLKIFGLEYRVECPDHVPSVEYPIRDGYIIEFRVIEEYKMQD